MRLEHYSLETLKKEILARVGRHLDLDKYQIFFFGSRVSGKGDDRSDIDVGIEGNAPVSSKIWSGVKDEVDSIRILYSIDLVDFKTVDPAFYKVARQNIELIN